MSEPAPGSGRALVELAAARWSVGEREILGPLDLEVEAGECVAVVGPNGAGKTTLLRLVSGLIRPTGGSIAWRGLELGELDRRELARRVAYVPQVRPSRIPLSVHQLVLLGRYPYLSRFQMSPRAEDYAAAETALRRVGLEALRDRPVDELSGGERQAVFIAAALAQEAELMVLDEPTTHLDPSHQLDITRLIERSRREAGRTVLTATHDLNFAATIADRVVALRRGEILASGSPAETMRPELLERLFEAPFEVVRGGERPVTVLELGEVGE